jgi:hypothetical protein
MISLPFFANITTPGEPRRSKYYTFSKSLKDFDKSVVVDGKYYFTKMVTLNLPLWDTSNMYFRFRKNNSTNPGDIVNYNEVLGDINFPTGIELEATTLDYVNPNMVIPRLFMAYMENLIRQSNVLISGGSPEEITEIAFWKTLNFMGISPDQIFGDNSTVVTFMNHIATSNFIEVTNNVGWAEIIGSIPNRCQSLSIDSTMWRTVSGINNIVSADVPEDTCLFDGSSGNQFTFDMSGFDRVLDFEQIWERGFNEIDTHTFDFNTILLFYIDETGVEKLHGVNFIYPYSVSDGVGYEWNTQTIQHLTNQIQSFGYSFKWNMKSNNNDATKSEVFTIQEGTFWDTFSETLGLFNSFFEQQRQRGNII